MLCVDTCTMTEARNRVIHIYFGISSRSGGAEEFMLGGGKIRILKDGKTLFPSIVKCSSVSGHYHYKKKEKKCIEITNAIANEGNC